jgi:hypothetical protein
MNPHMFYSRRSAATRPEGRALNSNKLFLNWTVKHKELVAAEDRLRIGETAELRALVAALRRESNGLREQALQVFDGEMRLRGLRPAHGNAAAPSRAHPAHAHPDNHTPGQRSGQGSASVLPHLEHDLHRREHDGGLPPGRL